ncbi:hypothetical protein S40288_01647 [Stachybotrys chartarum IBT 40288]|nr:hypothetical protein S40288_01647 [Stachybotrys chartarum IBT 40288]
MPPRTSQSRAARVGSREPDAHTSTTNADVRFKKPNLPPLAGTPSSRRQYSYGAEVEPLPTRLRRGTKNPRVMDLGEAVRDAVSRQEQEEREEREERERTARMRAQRAAERNQARATDEDELAGDAAAFQPTENTEPEASQAVTGPVEIYAMSEFDDTRSFDIESDYYGEATIGSTSGLMGPPPVPRLSDARTGSAHDQDTYSYPDPAAEEIQGSEEDEETDGESEAESEEEEIAAEPMKRRVAANSSVPKQTMISKPELRKSRMSSRETSEGSAPETGVRATAGSRSESGPTVPSRQSPQRTWQPRRKTPVVLNTDDPNSALYRLTRNPELRSSKLNDEAAQEIRQQVDADDERRRLEAQPLDFWLARARESPVVTRFWPLPPEPEEYVFPEDSVSSTTEEPETVNWWLLLNPWTYIEALMWLLGGIYNSITRGLGRLVPSQLRNDPDLAKKIALSLFATLGAVLLAVSIGYTTSGSRETGWYGESRGAADFWPDFGQLTSKIAQYIPRVTWPSSNPWDEISDLWDTEDDEYARMMSILQRYQDEINRLREARSLHAASLNKLEAVVPKVVHMQEKDGKLVVGQDFWHALRGIIHKDDSFFTLEKRGGTYEPASKAQWNALAAHLVRDPTFQSKLDGSISAAEARINSQQAGSWESWIRSNNGKIVEILGPQLTKLKSMAVDKSLDRHIEQVMKEQLGEIATSGQVVTRDEFLRHLRNEFTEHRSAIKAEIEEMEPQMKELVTRSVALAMQEAPAGMNREQITTLVDGLVRKTVAEMNLEAFAQGTIQAHWDAELRTQVNYFSPGSGAVFDPTLSSPPHDRKHGHGHGGGGGGLGPVRKMLHLRPDDAKDGEVALKAWTDEGECWCGAHTVDHRGLPHGARLSVFLGRPLVPQHLVLEHILPSATTDPGARPRELEVFAHIPDPAVRDRLRDFSATHFPSDDWDWSVANPDLPDAFVKIGQYTYDAAERRNGVHVYRFSSELLSLGAETDQLVMRAVSNYGAKDHTCFYRVRLYGQGVEE